MLAFQKIQKQFTDHIRQPDSASLPAGVEARRMAIYQSLVYKNIDGFISGGFPVCHSLFSSLEWEQLIRQFLVEHRCESPFFLDIAEEFLNYLKQNESVLASRPFIYELAHYEWLELVLDVSSVELPMPCKLSNNKEGELNVLDSSLRLSPLACNMAYQFPVHRIGIDFQPVEALPQPSCLLVYRDRDDAVQFMEISVTTYQLLALVEQTPDCIGAELLQVLAKNIGATDLDQVFGFGAEILQQLVSMEIVFVSSVLNLTN